jgi:hypothetical protein
MREEIQFKKMKLMKLSKKTMIKTNQTHKQTPSPKISTMILITRMTQSLSQVSSVNLRDTPSQGLKTTESPILSLSRLEMMRRGEGLNKRTMMTLVLLRSWKR